MMLLVQAHQRFGCYGVGSALAAAGDGCLEPSLFYPEHDLRFPDPKSSSMALRQRRA